MAPSEVGPNIAKATFSTSGGNERGGELRMGQ